MAITSYSDLKAAIRDNLVGHFISDDQAGVFVALAEDGLNRRLRIRQMVERVTGAITSQYYPLPADFIEPVNVTLMSTPNVPLRVITPDYADQQRGRLAGHPPAYFCMTGTDLEVVPAPLGSVTIELLYYSRIPALSADTPSNWLLSRASDLYLASALLQAAPYVMDPQRGAFWKGIGDAAEAELRAESDRALYGTSPLVRRLRRSYG
jgi:hypothetical protein